MSGRPWDATAIKRRLETLPPAPVYDPDTGLSRAEQDRFRAWLQRRKRRAPDPALPEVGVVPVRCSCCRPRAWWLEQAVRLKVAEKLAAWLKEHLVARGTGTVQDPPTSAVEAVGWTDLPGVDPAPDQESA